MKYRPEIDGLRALAVLAVIFFHAGITIFHGGYVGVDVFFVISGYLITTIILGDMAQGKFTIFKFYERRIRRILPALTIVMLACLPFAYYWMLPWELKEFSQSLIAVSLFFSNIFFWFRTGYFETTSELKPLLHTWSLAVEEQYYLFFPLLIIFLSRFGKRIMLVVLTLLGMASIIVAQLRVGVDPNSTFYFIFTRLWEILMGSLIAFYMLNKPVKNSIHKFWSLFVRQILSFLGVLMILYAIASFNHVTPFPSFYTLIPTLGTALIILFAFEKTIVGRFLSNKLLVGIGLISYSAYLWHQPIFAFARLISVKPPSDRLIFALVILSFGIAYLTWKYIESPFRDRTRFGQTEIFRFAAVSSVVIIGIGTLGVRNEGFGNRIAPNGMSFSRLSLITKPNYGFSRTCDYESFGMLEQCRNSDSPEILVWGDSYAMQWVVGILASHPEAKIIQFTKAACGSIIGLDSSHLPVYNDDCRNFNNDVITWLGHNPSVKYVVLSSRYSYYLFEDSYYGVDGAVVPVDKAITLSHMRKTLELITNMGIKPVVVEPLPTDGKNIGNCLIKKAFYFDSIDCRVEVSVYRESQVPWLLGEIEKDYPVIWLSDILCDTEFCSSEMDGNFIYSDAEHLSVEGSIYLGKKINFYKLIASE